MTENTGVAPPLYGVVEEPDDEQISAAEVAEVVEGRTGMPKAVATTVDTSEGVTLDDFAGTHTSTADQATSGQAVEAPATMLPAEPTAEQKISQLEAALAFARGSADRFAADLQAERRNRDSSERIAFFRRKEILKLEDQARQLAQRHERELIDQRKAFEALVITIVAMTVNEGPGAYLHAIGAAGRLLGQPSLTNEQGELLDRGFAASSKLVRLVQQRRERREREEEASTAIRELIQTLETFERVGL